jgi:hypothetical protein
VLGLSPLALRRRRALPVCWRLLAA